MCLTKKSTLCQADNTRSEPLLHHSMTSWRLYGKNTDKKENLWQGTQTLRRFHYFRYFGQNCNTFLGKYIMKVWWWIKFHVSIFLTHLSMVWYSKTIWVQCTTRQKRKMIKDTWYLHLKTTITRCSCTFGAVLWCLYNRQLEDRPPKYTCRMVSALRQYIIYKCYLNVLVIHLRIGIPYTIITFCFLLIFLYEGLTANFSPCHQNVFNTTTIYHKGNKIVPY